MNASQAVIHQIPFRKGHIEAIEQDGKQWVAVKPVCADLGVDHDGQRRKLASLAWACTEMISVQMPGDDQRRDVFCVDVDTLLMWLATIHASKIKASARPALIAYQKHVKKIIADYFLGRQAPPIDVAALVAEAVARVVAPLMAQIAAQQRLIEDARRWTERSAQSLVPSFMARRNRAALAALVDMIQDGPMVDRTTYAWKHAYAAELKALYKAAAQGEAIRFEDMTWEQSGRAEQWLRQRTRTEAKRLRRTKAGRQRVASVRKAQRGSTQTEMFN